MNYKKDFNDLTHLSKIGMDNFTDTFVESYKKLDQNFQFDSTKKSKN